MCLRIAERIFVPVLGLFLFLFITFPARSQAYRQYSDGFLFDRIQADPVARILADYGIKLILVSQPSGADMILGRWDKTSKTIFVYVRDQVSVDNSLVTLYHEAIHVAQWCYGVKSHSSSSLPLGLFVDDFSREMFAGGRRSGFYRDSQSELEPEAYALESRPDDVITLLRLHCG